MTTAMAAARPYKEPLGRGRVGGLPTEKRFARVVRVRQGLPGVSNFVNVLRPSNHHDGKFIEGKSIGFDIKQKILNQ
jgi:hypothetical protein